MICLGEHQEAVLPIVIFPLLQMFPGPVHAYGIKTNCVGEIPVVNDAFSPPLVL